MYRSLFLMFFFVVSGCTVVSSMDSIVFVENATSKSQRSQRSPIEGKLRNWLHFVYKQTEQFAPHSVAERTTDSVLSTEANSPASSSTSGSGLSGKTMHPLDAMKHVLLKEEAERFFLLRKSASASSVGSDSLSGCSSTRIAEFSGLPKAAVRPSQGTGGMKKTKASAKRKTRYEEFSENRRPFSRKIIETVTNFVHSLKPDWDSCFAFLKRRNQTQL